ncbi:MAG: cob(I)yrinic acid a,c-diamide adenosyltransferase [Oscillospiraceae bacterium]
MEQEQIGLIHLYCGDGKGKTTAAAGLSLRAAGAGKRVLFVQFFKNGNSCEVKALNQMETVRTMHSAIPHHRFSKMDEQERVQARDDYRRLLDDALAAAREDVNLLVLDEVISACNHEIISEETLLEFLRTKPECLEVVLTGRDPSDALLSLADYVTEMRKIKHPYDRGVRARRGIEF